jgi:hypothetical protein
MITKFNGMLGFTPVRDENGKVDVEASTQAARRVAEEFAKEDDSLTVKLGEAAVAILEQEKFASLKHISTAALGRMALLALGIIPNDKACKDAVVRLKSSLAEKQDKILLIKSGVRAGVHYKPRYSEAELKLIQVK